MDNQGNSETTYFGIQDDVTTVSETTQERAMVKAALPLIDELLDRLQARITFYDTLNSIEVDLETDPEAYIRQHIANAQTKANLELEKQYLETLKDTHSK